MTIQFICPTWGMDLNNPAAVIEKIINAGYDGIEIGFPLTHPETQAEILLLAKEANLNIIAQHYDADGDTIDTYIDSYSMHLRFLASLQPRFINAQSGKDYFTFEENCRVLQAAFQIEKETGIKIVHETHRGKFSYSLPLMNDYLNRFPGLRITADFSHYCVVSESFLQTTRQQQMLDDCISRTDHLHARVGFTQGPQVNDPRAKEWQQALNYHLQWWDAIIDIKRKTNNTLTITPEFGPAPYMPQLPHTCTALADQWEVNLFMKNLLQDRSIFE